MTGSSKYHAKNEVEQSIDRLIYYAGWSDKFQQIFSSVNPVASNHFNFSVPKAMGVVSVIASKKVQRRHVSRWGILKLKTFQLLMTQSICKKLFLLKKI